MDYFIILVYILTCFGLCTILIDSIGPWHVFEKCHTWMEKHTPMLGELFSCYICLPTWVGLIASILNIILMPYFSITPFNILLYGIMPWYVIAPLDAMFTSGSIWLIHTFQSAVEKYAYGDNEEQ